MFFFFNDTATTEIYTLSLHDALPISHGEPVPGPPGGEQLAGRRPVQGRIAQEDVLVNTALNGATRSEEHTSELQSLAYLVCRLLLEKKKKPQAKYSPTSAGRHTKIEA